MKVQVNTVEPHELKHSDMLGTYTLPYRRARFYLKVRHGDSVNLVLLGLVDFVKQVIERQHHDTMILVRPKHCVGLASTCEGEEGRREGGREGRSRGRKRFCILSEMHELQI